MRSTFIKRQPVLAVACALALGVFSATASAQRMDPNEKALLLDTRGAPVMSGGLCWHTGYGPASLWTAGCYAERPVPVAQYVVVAAPAPTPAPVVVAAAAPLPVYEKVAFDANVLFDSNKSVLRPADRDALDAFVSKISGLESQSVMAIGYADRMGTDASNQLLSEKRAGAVKSYLISKGVPADRVKTSAWGETRPSTATGGCKDANNPKNVACMQPDRHVSVEISGARLGKQRRERVPVSLPPTTSRKTHEHSRTSCSNHSIPMGRGGGRGRARIRRVQLGRLGDRRHSGEACRRARRCSDRIVAHANMRRPVQGERQGAGQFCGAEGNQDKLGAGRLRGQRRLGNDAR